MDARQIDPNRGGFALPAAILAMVAIVTMVTGTFFVARQESRIGVASENTQTALYLAELGIAEAMNGWSYTNVTNPWTQTTTTSGTAAGGTWSVTITPMTDRIYYLESTGTVTAGGAVRAGATREVGVIARFVTVGVNPPAALTTREGFTANGAPNKVNGDDADPPGWPASVCPASLQNKPGVLTDNAGAIQTTGRGRGGGGCPSQIDGSPCILEDEPQVDEVMEIFEDARWNELVQQADLTLTSLPGGKPSPSFIGGVCNTADPYNWGSPSSPTGPCGGYFPIIHLVGDHSMQGNTEGQGILLVEGVFGMRGTPRFDGLILVKGTFDAASGTPDVNGAVITQEVDRLNGTPHLYYSSCAVNRAIMESSAARLRPIGQRSWVDISSVRN